jgi:peroxiredoxin Q/BCP
MLPELNSLAPDFALPDHIGKEHKLSTYRGSWVVIYFYPKDDTPGCTIEACGLRDSYASLSARIAIVGVSGDDSTSHRKFADKFKLPFTLLADTSRKTIETYGADGLLFPKRVTFIIDPTNVIRKIYHGFDANDHAAMIAKDLDELGV